MFLKVCGRRYKNGPGLKYHYTHYNHEQDASATQPEEPVVSHVPTPAVSIPIESPKVPSPPQQRGPGRPKKCSGADVSPNNYCDFCLGDVFENKKTGHPEELLSCADCGRSGALLLFVTSWQFSQLCRENVTLFKQPGLDLFSFILLLIEIANTSGLYIRAGSRRSSPASLPGFAGYFHCFMSLNMSRRWTHNRLLFTKFRLLKNLKKTLHF